MPLIKLNIQGYQGKTLPVVHLKQENEQCQHFAIVFPGLNYNVFMPGLFFPRLVMESKGADVFQVEYDYTTQEFQTESKLEQYQWITSDAAAAFQAARALRDYSRITLIGKSIGTVAMGHLLTAEPTLQAVDYIWLTPLIKNDALRTQIASRRHHALFVIGTADYHYDASLLAEIEAATGGESLVLEGVNHGLLVEGKPLASVQGMQQIVERIEAFII